MKSITEHINESMSNENIHESMTWKNSDSKASSLGFCTKKALDSNKEIKVFSFSLKKQVDIYKLEDEIIIDGHGQFHDYNLSIELKSQNDIENIIKQMKSGDFDYKDYSAKIRD